MFKRSQKATENQIPADLFATIHSPQARRRRWAVEIIISLLIVVGLEAGGMLLYKKLSNSDEQRTVPKSNAERVMQSPQSSDNTQENTEAPISTPETDATNSGTVEQPQ